MIDLRLRQVTKQYLAPAAGGGRRLWGLLQRRERFRALDDVSFEVGTGETLGVIGPNGAGKTTLIKLISGITAPSQGEIEISGRLASLVEVGAGFQPDLTGRENIFLNGAIMGMSRAEIERKLPAILDFAEIGRFLDAPVKHYSSGMFVRLGFAIAAHVDADILLLDEVLAVGDIAFQARCLDRIEDLRRAGKTVLLVSHDLAAVERICSRALLFAGGRIAASGSPRDVIDAYLLAGATHGLGESAGDATPFAITGLVFEGPDGTPARTGEPLTCRISYRTNEAVDDVLARVTFLWPSGYLCAELAGAGLRLERGRGEIVFDCPMLVMQRGMYPVSVHIERRGATIASKERCSLLRVAVGTVVPGDFLQPHNAYVRAFEA